MKKLAETVLALALAASLLPAASLGYEDLRSSMLSGNAELKAAEEKTEQSLLDVKDAKANYQPEISLMATASYLVNPPEIDIDISDISTGLNVLGSMYGLTVPDTLTKELDSTYYNVALSVSEPILTWGKRPMAVKLYQNLADITGLSKLDMEMKKDAELKTELTALRYIEDLLVLLDEADATAQELVQASQDGYEDGMLLRQDVVEARVDALEVQVQKKEVQKLYSDLLQEVRTLTALPELEGSDIDFTPDEAEILYISQLDRDYLRQEAVSAEAVPLRMLMKQSAAYQQKENIAKAGMYMIPDLALNVTATAGGSKFPGQKDWADSDDWGLAITVGVSTTVWDGGKKLNELKRSKSQLEESYAAYDSAVSQLQAAVEDSITTIDLSLARLDYLEVSVEAEKGRLELLELKEETGASSRTEVLSQQLEVLKKEMEIVQEKVSLARAAYTLSYLARL